jgi:ERCC4-related helicase
MADEETKQLLREIQAILKQQLEIMRGTNEANAATQKQNDDQIRLVTERYEKQAQEYDRAAARYDQSVRAISTANNVANVLRSIALIGIAAVLAYLVFFGLHKH